MTQYYYLVASLPLLFFDDAPPWESRSWLELCREQLSETDHARLSRISLDDPRADPDDPEIWRQYADWETAMRNELVVQRAQRLGINADPFIRDASFNAHLAGFIKETLAAGTPKQVETALDRLRWKTLDELESRTQFDLGKLICYRLKLQILERRDRLRPDTGLDAFNTAYSHVIDTAAVWTGSAQ